MKIQSRMLVAIILSLIISTIISIFLINLILTIFDKSLSRYDVEKFSLRIINELKNYRKTDTADIERIFNKFKTDKIDFTLFDDDKRRIITSTIKNFDFGRQDLFKKSSEDVKRMEGSINRYIKFIDVSDARDFTLRRPVVFRDNSDCILFITFKKDLFSPFSIRINQDKIVFVYVIIFAIIALILLFSYILMLVFTMPLINRLRVLFNKINSFELTNPNIKINDNYNDEIGVISRTFDRMSDKISQDYNERIKFYLERQELIKNISHDFRTPLTSILGYSVSLDDGVYDNEEEQKKYYKIIRKKAEYMSALFDELMELSRLDSNAFILKKTDFDIAEMLREIAIEYIPQLEKEKFFIETDIPESLVINADKDRLSRALRNIIDNTVKHAREGKYLGLFLRKIENDKIILKLADKGRGIKAGDENRIFSRFYKNSPFAGMGVGLSITREIIEKHGGTISVESREEEGSSFTIILPKS